MYSRSTPSWGNSVPSPYPPEKQRTYQQSGFAPSAQQANSPAAVPPPSVSGQTGQYPASRNQTPAAEAPSGVSGRSNNDNYISHKICKINGRDKVVDFTSKLTAAKTEDYAMVHGCGGSNHAPNSTIGITLCDYTKGKGDNKSVTVRYAIDVEDTVLLLEAAKTARLNGFSPNAGNCTPLCDSLIQQLKDLAKFPSAQDGSRQIPRDALNGLLRSANGLRTAMQGSTGPLFSYKREKNNPYKIVNGLAPVSKVEISYTPFRSDGSESRYPWYIAIENFDAPINAKANGATSHNAAQAVNKRSAFINLTTDDFLAAMVAIERFVRLWEHRLLPVMEEAYSKLEGSKAEAPQSQKQESNQYPAGSNRRAG